MAGLLIIYTGGTIGMVQGEGGLRPGEGVLEAGLRATAPEGLDLSVIQFSPLVDSADIGRADWNRMLDLIEDWPGEGVIVVHGTDTMAFTGAALSAVLGESKRVVLCGSMVPLGMGGDAEANLALALATATTAVSGVWLAFAGRVMPAAGLVKRDSHSADAFRSVPQTAMVAPARRYGDKRLAIISLSPGLPATAVAAMLKALDGAVLRVFGAGTMMGDAQLAGVLAAAVARGCRLRAVSQCERGGVTPAAYAAGAALWQAGVESGGEETAELALARLWLSLSA